MAPDRIIFHIDVNSAFLSWEALEHLKKEAVLIFVLCRQSWPGIRLKGMALFWPDQSLQKYGIVTGEPVVKAVKKCPEAIIVPPSHDVYARYSKAMTDLLYSFSPDLEKYSIDECFINATGLRLRYRNDFFSWPI